MEANWTDPLLFFIYSVAKPVSAALILVVMLDIVSGGHRDPAYRGVRRRRDRALVVRDRRDRRSGLVGPRRPRALPDAQVRRTSARATSWSCCSGAVSRASASGPWAPSITIAIGVVALGVQFDLSRRGLARCSSSSWSSGSSRSSPSGSCWPRSASRPGRSRGRYPEAVGGRAVPRQRRGLPARRPPDAPPGGRAADPADVVDRRRAARPSSRAGSAASAGPAACGRRSPEPSAPDARTIVLALLVTGALVTLAATGIFRTSERRAKDRGLLDRTTGS